MAQTKRQKTIKAAVVPGKAYPIDEALKIVKDNSTAKFVEAVDVAVRLGVADAVAAAHRQLVVHLDRAATSATTS